MNCLLSFTAYNIMVLTETEAGRYEIRVWCYHASLSCLPQPPVLQIGRESPVINQPGRMLSASAHPHNPMNAGTKANSEYRTWMFRVYSENKADVHDVMKSICILSLAIPAQLLEVKD